MDKIIINGGNRLIDKVQVEEARSAVLPILTASLLAPEGKSKLTNVPDLSDVAIINNVLSTLDAKVDYDKENGLATVDASAILNKETPYEYVNKMRVSVLVMGPLLARLGHAIVTLPGGCAIGVRPIEQHIKGFEALGAETHLEDGNIYASTKEGLKGANIHLDSPSVGATQNIIMGASLAQGRTVIENVAKEPKIVDLANCTNEMGSDVIGAGTDIITIHGVEKLTGVKHTIIPDRIEAGTFAIVAAITRGDVLVKGAVKEHMTSLIYKLEKMEVNPDFNEEGVHVTTNGGPQPVGTKTLSHPSFPTGMWSQMMVLLLTVKGHKVVTETVSGNRSMHATEFRRMDANINVEGRSAKIENKGQP